MIAKMIAITLGQICEEVETLQMSLPISNEDNERELREAVALAKKHLIRAYSIAEES